MTKTIINVNDVPVLTYKNADNGDVSGSVNHYYANKYYYELMEVQQKLKQVLDEVRKRNRI